MADIVFNIAKGKIAEYAARIDGNDPTNAVWVIVLLKTDEADATLEDYDTLSALLAGSNTEADFTNYARIVLSDSDISAPTPDDSGDSQSCDFSDQTWSSAGGASNNTLASLLVCYDSDSTGGDDTNIVPCTKHDFVLTTDGSDITATLPAAGFYTAT